MAKTPMTDRSVLTSTETLQYAYASIGGEYRIVTIEERRARNRERTVRFEADYAAHPERYPPRPSPDWTPSFLLDEWAFRRWIKPRQPSPPTIEATQVMPTRLALTDDFAEIMVVRCLECRKVLGRLGYIEAIRQAKRQGLPLATALDEIGVTRPCCRKHFLCIDRIAPGAPDDRPVGLLGTSAHVLDPLTGWRKYSCRVVDLSAYRKPYAGPKPFVPKVPVFPSMEPVLSTSTRVEASYDESNIMQAPIYYEDEDEPMA